MADKKETMEERIERAKESLELSDDYLAIFMHAWPKRPDSGLSLYAILHANEEFMKEYDLNQLESAKSIIKHFEGDAEKAFEWIALGVETGLITGKNPYGAYRLTEKGYDILQKLISEQGSKGENDR